jgi:hypothetical protein
LLAAVVVEIAALAVLAAVVLAAFTILLLEQ